MNGPRRLLWLVIVAAASIWVELPVNTAQSGCSIQTTPVQFGLYSVYSSSPTLASGLVRYQCVLGILVRVELSTGSANGFSPRRMTGPAAALLDYNLFLDNTYSTIWGNGTNGTGHISHVVTALVWHQATVYGRVPAQQDVRTGSYSDTITASVIW